MRRIIVGLMALAALAIVFPTDASRAQETFPSRLVRIVVPYPAGGGTDTLARLHRRPTRPQMGAIGDRGEYRRRRRQYRLRRGGTRGARRLHAAPRLARPDRHQQLSLQGHALRPGALDPDRPVGNRPLRAGAAQELRRRDRERPDRARQGQSGKNHRRDAGHRLGRPPLDRAARNARRHQDRARALPRLRPRHQRPHRRSRRPDVRHADDVGWRCIATASSRSSRSAPASASASCRTSRPSRNPAWPAFAR